MEGNNTEIEVGASESAGVDESRIRNDAATDELFIDGKPTGLSKSQLERFAFQHAVERDREARVKRETEQRFVKTVGRGVTSDDKFFANVERFDPNNPDLQFAEFYKCHSAEFDRFGYF